MQSQILFASGLRKQERSLGIGADNLQSHGEIESMH